MICSEQLKFWLILLLLSSKGIIVSSHSTQENESEFIQNGDSFYLVTEDSMQEEIILFCPSIIENSELENGIISIIADSAICISYPKDAVPLQLLSQQQTNKTIQKQMHWIQMVVYIGSFLLALLSLYLIYKHIRYKKQKNLMLLQSRELKEKTKEIINQKLQDNIRVEQLQLLNNERNLYFEQFIATQSFYQSLVNLLKEHKDNLHNHELIDEALWKTLITTLNEHTNNFSNRLQQQYLHLRPQDIRFCCLIKIGLKYADIACLSGRTSNMMYKRREVVMNRMGISISKSLFDDFIKDF